MKHESQNIKFLKNNSKLYQVIIIHNPPLSALELSLSHLTLTLSPFFDETN